MIETLFRIVMKIRFVLIPAAAVAFFFFGYHASLIGTDPAASIDSILPEDDPVKTADDMVNAAFHLERGEGELYFALKSDTLYSSSVLKYLARLSQAIEDIPGVASMTDIFTASSIRGDQNGDLLAGPFIERDADFDDPSVVAMLQRNVSGDPFAARRLVNANGTATVLCVKFDKGVDTRTKNTLINSVQNMIESEKSTLDFPLELYIAGDAIVQRAIVDVQAGEGFIFPLMVGVLALILFIVFRSISGVLIPLAIMMISVTTTIGVKALFGSSMSTIDPMLYALMTTISVSDSIHIVSAWYGENPGSLRGTKDSISKTLSHSLYPCFLTSVTTSIGFASVAITGIPQIRAFGLVASAGVMIAWLWTFLLTGPLLALLYPLSSKIRIMPLECVLRRFSDSAYHIPDALSRFVTMHAKQICLLFGLVFVLSVFASLRIKTGTDPYSFLKETHCVNRSLRFMEKEFSGIGSMDLVFTSNEEGLFKRVASLQKLDSVMTSIGNIPGVTKVESLVTYVKQMNRALGDGDVLQYALPHTDAHVSQYLLLYEMSGDSDTLSRWVSDDYSDMRIHLSVANDADAKKIQRAVESLSASIDLGENIHYTVSGATVLWKRIDSMFIRGQITSLALSMTVILAILCFVFSSLRLGIYSALVNVFPIVFGLGLMGVFGIPLSMGTVMISSIAIGIAVDDTIHFVFRYKQQSPAATYQDRLVATNRLTFRPVLFTSVILAIGFFSNALSSFRPNAYFGILSSAVIIAACAADLFAMPALIKLFGGGNVLDGNSLAVSKSTGIQK